MTIDEAIKILEDERYMIWETDAEKEFALKRNQAFDMAINALEEMDNAQNTLQHVGGVERPKGHWITKWSGNGWNEDWDYICSACGKEYKKASSVLSHASYCPDCGANMRGECDERR